MKHIVIKENASYGLYIGKIHNIILAADFDYEKHRKPKEPLLIVSDYNDVIVTEHFISLADWRNQQIDSILEEE